MQAVVLVGLFAVVGLGVSCSNMLTDLASLKTVTAVETSDAKSMTAFDFYAADNAGVLLRDIEAEIDQDEQTIMFAIPFPVYDSELAPRFVSTGVSVRVNDVLQTSGTSKQSFADAVDYTVSASDGTTRTYQASAVPEAVLSRIMNDTPVPNEYYKFYMSTALAADENYFAAFNAWEVRFFDLSNPHSPEVVADRWVVSGGDRQPQAITSIGDYVFLAQTSGWFTVFDWSDRNDPAVVYSGAISAGQNFDIADNGVDTVFIANTSNNTFLAVSVADPENPGVIYTDDQLNGFGAGVAYYDGHAYAAGFGGHIYAYEFSEGAWTRTAASVDGIAAVANASRLAVIGNHLYVHKYAADEFDIFSLADPAAPVHAGTLTLDANVSTYMRPVQSGSHMYVGTDGGVLEVYDVTAPGSPVLDHELTDALAEYLFDEELYETQGGVLGMTVFPGRGLFSIVSINQNDSAIRQISFVHDPVFYQ